MFTFTTFEMLHLRNECSAQAFACHRKLLSLQGLDTNRAVRLAAVNSSRKSSLPWRQNMELVRVYSSKNWLRTKAELCLQSCVQLAM